ncbi:ATP-binding protein [Ancylothrix sp. C2]|uniref:ATP-binding protein n=1 Tax=Ancylothrix sp. D3o TaxID=2953691 RepID=UPI0021BAEF72|nr:ATP-binding protein [Ancylothrix sp. D3o]MCT7950387.1 ATP-binding protein [Ancylothrix sp. D3o]
MDLKNHPFITYFDTLQAEKLCQQAVVENFSSETIIFEEGEIPDYLYLVLEGQVEFSKHMGIGKNQIVAFANINEFFGEFGVLDGQPRSAKATATAGTTLAKIPCDQLMEILHQTNGGVVLNIFRHIIQRLRGTTEQLVSQVVYKEKMVLIGEMINTLIHDFKSPFTSIQLASEMLKEQHLDADTQEWCELIQAQITQMLSMADEVLEFSRGNSTLYKTPINVIDLLNRFHRLNRNYFQHTKVAFIFDAPDLTLSIDETKILRVLQNLVSNAVEAFNDQGGEIEIKVRATGNRVQIKIADNGPGIPQEIQKRLFEPFVTYGKSGGTGLGTAISQSIINAHGGEISFQSKVGAGTTFYIYLPL